MTATTRPQPATRSLLVACCTLALVACHDLTSVDAPDLVQPGDLANAQGALTQYNGAILEFYSAFGGPATNNGPYVTSSGLIADEFTAADALPGIVDLDRRALPTPLGSSGVYDTLQSARIKQLQPLRALPEFVPADRWRVGQLYANLGYLETFLGESMCSGVPLGDIVDSKPVYGDPLPTPQLFARALADFDSAQQYGADSARVVELASVGQGRVLLDLNRYSDAAAAVSAVPTAFQFITEHSATIIPNYLFTAITSGRYMSVADHEGGNGLDFTSAGDPRIPTTSVGFGLDGTTPVFAWAVITSEASPNVVASGIEARLIEAEAALAAGDPSWLTKLNDLRATAISPAMPALADPGSPIARVDLLFRERAFWLFGTGHRLGDLRRLVRQYGRTQDQVFPTGAYKYGNTYGTDVDLPIDPTEVSANPKLNGQACLDRNP
jgi:hypothetical protein